jgi:hypothetical protein
VPEPRLGQRCSCQIAVVAGDDQVQVLVGPAVAAKQRINAPAALQPHHQPGLVEPVEDPKHIGGVQHWRSQPPLQADDNRHWPRLRAPANHPTRLARTTSARFRNSLPKVNVVG